MSNFGKMRMVHGDANRPFGGKKEPFTNLSTGQPSTLTTLICRLRRCAMMATTFGSLHGP
jgi:hypothetical protein